MADEPTPDVNERFEQAPFSVKPENIDEEHCILRNVFLLGRKSQHGYEYEQAGHIAAHKRFEQMLLGVDHDYKFGPLTSDVAWGVIHDPYVTEEGTFAKEVHYLGSHKKTPAIIESLRRNLGIFAISPVINNCIERPKGRVVSFDPVRCDVVAGGGATTGRRFFEQEPPPLLKELQDSVTALKADVAALKQENADLKARATKYEQYVAPAATVAAEVAKVTEGIDLKKFWND